MLIYSIGVSVDGFIADRDGDFGWGAPSEELFRFHLEAVRELGGYLLGRRLYETMLVWRPILRGATTRTRTPSPTSVRDPEGRLQPHARRRRGNARLAEASWPRRSPRRSTRQRRTSRSAAPAAAQAVELGLVDELRVFRFPVVVGGGTACRRSPRTSGWT